MTRKEQAIGRLRSAIKLCQKYKVNAFVICDETNGCGRKTGNGIVMVANEPQELLEEHYRQWIEKDVQFAISSVNISLQRLIDEQNISNKQQQVKQE